MSSGMGSGGLGLGGPPAARHTTPGQVQIADQPAATTRHGSRATPGYQDFWPYQTGDHRAMIHTKAARPSGPRGQEIADRRSAA